MPVTNEHIGRRVQYTDRKDRVTYGTVRSVDNKFVDIKREDATPRTFYVPIDSLVLVDEDGTPQLN